MQTVPSLLAQRWTRCHATANLEDLSLRAIVGTQLGCRSPPDDSAAELKELIFDSSNQLFRYGILHVVFDMLLGNGPEYSHIGYSHDLAVKGNIESGLCRSCNFDNIVVLSSFSF
jgi:hypothetical protein